MSSKKELVRNAFHNEKTERIPVGFWHHYLTDGDFNGGLEDPSILEENLAGAKKFKEEFDPDFVKVMTDGFFTIPYDLSEVKNAAGLKTVEPLSEEDPWFEKNVELAARVRELYGDYTEVETMPKNSIKYRNYQGFSKKSSA